MGQMFYVRHLQKFFYRVIFLILCLFVFFLFWNFYLEFLYLHDNDVTSEDDTRSTYNRHASIATTRLLFATIK